MVVTNALGIAFTAAVLSASDAGVTFVFPEDGATNTIAWTKLSPASQRTIAAETGYERLSPAQQRAQAKARTELERTAIMEREGQIDAETAARRRAAIQRLLDRR